MNPATFWRNCLTDKDPFWILDITGCTRGDQIIFGVVLGIERRVLPPISAYRVEVIRVPPPIRTMPVP